MALFRAALLAFLTLARAGEPVHQARGAAPDVAALDALLEGVTLQVGDPDPALCEAVEVGAVCGYQLYLPQPGGPPLCGPGAPPEVDDAARSARRVDVAGVLPQPVLTALCDTHGVRVLTRVYAGRSVQGLPPPGAPVVVPR